MGSEIAKLVSEMTDVVIENGPVEGWIHFDVTDDGVVIKDYSLKIDNYIADYSEDIIVTKDGTLSDMPIVRTIDNEGYYNIKWIGTNPVYFDPTGNNTNCSETDYDNNPDKLGKSGCMKWYAYSENADGTVNMLLDHNMGGGAWVSKADYEKSYYAEDGAQSLGITYPNDTIVGTDDYNSNWGNWNKGPITLLKKLKADTEDWNGVPSRSDSYIDINNYYGENTTNYTINYSGYKARLIKVREISRTRGGWIYSNCVSSGCAYWTVSSDDYKSAYNNGGAVWFVGYLDYKSVFGFTSGFPSWGYVSRSWGLRPVITVSKSDIFES